MIADLENNMAMIGQLSFISKLHNLQYYSGTSSILVLKENIETVFFATTFTKFDPFIEIHNKMMGRLADSGILNLFYAVHVNPKGFVSKNDEIGPQVLTMDHLMIGFQICLAVMVASFVAFVVEITLKRYQNITMKIKVKVVSKMLKFFNLGMQKCQMKKRVAKPK